MPDEEVLYCQVSRLEPYRMKMIILTSTTRSPEDDGQNAGGLGRSDSAFGSTAKYSQVLLMA